MWEAQKGGVGDGGEKLEGMTRQREGIGERSTAIGLSSFLFLVNSFLL